MSYLSIFIGIVLTFVFITAYEAIHAILCALLWSSGTHPSYRGSFGMFQIIYAIATCVLGVMATAAWGITGLGVWEYLAAASPSLFFLMFPFKFWYSPAFHAMMVVDSEDVDGNTHV